MSGLDYVDYVPLNGGVGVVRNTRNLGAGLALVLVGAAGWVVSQSDRFFHFGSAPGGQATLPSALADHPRGADILAAGQNSEQGPARAASHPAPGKQQQDELLEFGPGPPVTVRTMISSRMYEDPPCFFAYGELGKEFLASDIVQSGAKILPGEGEIYGATFDNDEPNQLLRLLAFPSGDRKHVVKGQLLSWSPDTSHASQVAEADGFYGFDPANPRGAVRRGVVWVIRGKGPSVPATWYFLKPHHHSPPYECRECGQTITTMSKMSRHMRIHSGEKPYPCPQCHKAFARSDSLTVHMRVHNGHRPYQCVECGKNFSDLSGMRQHMRTHTGEKPYSCTECEKNFSRADLLKRHLIKVHNIDKGKG
eukprot:gb/GEZN01009046.1/.p1 GENE.gb/GEZN01009046.1/~~gb/GEZN01009046.1/.p1  ORF type:complete len:365 (-),score=25.39 gb/GEZN01009046.1/:166-1260(-)